MIYAEPGVGSILGKSAEASKLDPYGNCASYYSLLIICTGMEKHSTETLQEYGVRVTPQRTLIWEALAESGEHFTAERLWDRVRGSLPGLELSTVYRALETLQGAGLVADSRLPEGPRVFEAQPSMHPHLVGRKHHFGSAVR